MLDSIKALLWKMKINIELWIASLHLNSSDIICLASCFGVGFLSGILLKRSFKYLIIFLVSIVLLLASLSYLQLIIINFAKIKSLTGTESIVDLQTALTAIMCCSKKYIFEFGSVSFGFILGLKTG